MNEIVTPLPNKAKAAERKIIISFRPKNGHRRLQKALDILLTYLMELERKNQGDQKVPDQEPTDQLSL